MTGRGAGTCAGYDRPGIGNIANRLGLGLGFRGGNRGWRNAFFATGLPGWARAGFVPPAPIAREELGGLKAQATWLSRQLEAIRKQIEDIEGRGEAPTK